jgi:outer membrane lipoprotein-sorting protein
MHLLRPVCRVVVCVSLCAQMSLQPSSFAAKQAQTAPQSGLTSNIKKDAQALAILNQAFINIGGLSAVQKIDDYTATGQITYHLAEDRQGGAVIRGRAWNDLRIDATLPDGVRSEATTQGSVFLKSEDGTIAQISSSAPLAASRMLLPYLILVPVINSSGYSISYDGIEQVGNFSAHHVRVQRQLPGLSDPDGNRSEQQTLSYWIDVTTYQVLMMQDTLSINRVRTISYSDYRIVNGIWVPFSIEQKGGYQACSIHLNEIKFNSGLQDADFQL